jgi:RNA polymerase sigma-70 factor (ECF subfamily)
MDSDEIISQLEALHADAFGWAVSCCCGDRHRGEDVLQAAYAKALSGAAKFRGSSVLKTWWFGVIRLTAFEEARRARRWFGLLDRWHAEPASEDFSPERAVGREELDALTAALRELSPRQREILHLAFYQELSLSEAAAVLSISVGSARQHYERGKSRLRELLEAQKIRHE